MVKKRKAARIGKAKRAKRVPKTEEIRQPDAFDSFLVLARRGAEFVYHIGMTAFDDKANARIPAAQRAFEAFEAGKVHLVQRRAETPGLFEFIARKT